VRIAITRRDDALCIAIGNPVGGATARAEGNRMALANIRERLALYYDLEARLDIERGVDAWETRIVLPWKNKTR